MQTSDYYGRWFLGQHPISKLLIAGQIFVCIFAAIRVLRQRKREQTPYLLLCILAFSLIQGCVDFHQIYLVARVEGLNEIEWVNRVLGAGEIVHQLVTLSFCAVLLVGDALLVRLHRPRSGAKEGGP